MIKMLLHAFTIIGLLVLIVGLAVAGAGRDFNREGRMIGRGGQTRVGRALERAATRGGRCASASLSVDR